MSEAIALGSGTISDDNERSKITQRLTEAAKALRDVEVQQSLPWTFGAQSFAKGGR